MKEFIWRSFQASGKKHLFLTGSKGIGKTTVLREILEQGIEYGGIVTRVIREDGRMPNYILLQDINNDSLSTIVGSRNEEGSGIIPCLAGFEGYGVAILQSYLSKPLRWIILDEIGYLESDASYFKEAVRSCLREKQVIAVLRKDANPFLEEIISCPDALLIDLDGLVKVGL